MRCVQNAKHVERVGRVAESREDASWGEGLADPTHSLYKPQMLRSLQVLLKTTMILQLNV